MKRNTSGKYSFTLLLSASKGRRDAKVGVNLINRIELAKIKRPLEQNLSRLFRSFLFYCDSIGNQEFPHALRLKVNPLIQNLLRNRDTWPVRYLRSEDTRADGNSTATCPPSDNAMAKYCALLCRGSEHSARSCFRRLTNSCVLCA